MLRGVALDPTNITCISWEFGPHPPAVVIPRLLWESARDRPHASWTTSDDVGLLAYFDFFLLTLRYFDKAQCRLRSGRACGAKYFLETVYSLSRCGAAFEMIPPEADL